MLANWLTKSIHEQMDANNFFPRADMPSVVCDLTTDPIITLT